MSTPDPNKRTRKAPLGVGIALALTLGYSEGREHLPYYDQAGILTVCRGITGPEVIKGKWYSWAECDALEQRFIARMNETIGKCIAPAALTPGEWKAWGHFTYNIGTTAFCNSTAARLLREGKFVQACAQMPKWTYLTKPGRGKVNCRIKAERCGGIPKRRDLEFEMCMDGQPKAPVFG